MQAHLFEKLKSLAGSTPLTRFQRWAVVALVVLICAGAATAYLRSRPNMVDVSEGVAAGGTRRSKVLTVHVAGAVNSPGLYKLDEGTRVADALTEAGGATADAALDDINLAGRLQDGQKVMVPRAVSPQTAGAAPAEPQAGSLINVNTATAEQLDALPGVGPSLAQKIISWRTRNGPFSSLEDLDEVGGIGPAKLESLKDSVTF